MKLIKVYSKTCMPCKVLEKNLVQSGIKYNSVDISSDEGDRLARTYGIRTVPTLLLIGDDGHMIDKRVGILSVEELRIFAGEIQ